jgi:enoyl-CoA hydratase
MTTATGVSSANEVLVDVDENVMTLTINRPLQRNAMTKTASEIIAAALDDLDARSDVTVAIITGAGGTFCAGMDLKRFAAGEIARVPGRGFAGVTETPPTKPLIAAVEGWALGGGFELALACDLIVAGESAKFGLPEAKRGLIAGGGGALRLPRRVPRAIALQVLLTGEPLTAADALRFGLVNARVPDGTALDRARELAASIAANAPLAVAMSKRIVVESEDWTADEMFDRQRPYIDEIFATEDAAEGASAFAGRRAPEWKGR